jgi:hypothetical protein
MHGRLLGGCLKLSPEKVNPAREPLPSAQPELQPTAYLSSYSLGRCSRHPEYPYWMIFAYPPKLLGRS